MVPDVVVLGSHCYRGVLGETCGPICLAHRIDLLWTLGEKDPMSQESYSPVGCSYGQPIGPGSSPLSRRHTVTWVWSGNSTVRIS